MLLKYHKYVECFQIDKCQISKCVNFHQLQCFPNNRLQGNLFDFFKINFKRIGLISLNAEMVAALATNLL